MLSSFSAVLAAKTFTEKFDLKDLDEHNAIEHDGSLIRERHTKLIFLLLNETA